MISNTLPDLNVPKSWVESQLQAKTTPFFVEDKELGYRLLSLKVNVCWFIFTDQDLRFVVGSGSQTRYSFAKEFYTSQVAVHGVTYLDSEIKRRLCASEVECLEVLKDEPGVIQNLGHYYEWDENGNLYRGMINPYYPKKHLEMGKINFKRETSLKLIDIVRRVNEKGVIHRDIKLKNILLDEFGNPILADFGFACKKDSKLTKVMLGSLLNLAPELVEDFLGVKHRFTTRCDVWATAVTVYQILFQKIPSYINTKELEGLKFGELRTNPKVMGKMLEGMESFCKTIQGEEVKIVELKKMFVFHSDERPSLDKLFPVNNQKEKVKPLDNQRQIDIIQGGVIIHSNGRMRPTFF